MAETVARHETEPVRDDDACQFRPLPVRAERLPHPPVTTFAALADPARLRIVELLAQAPEGDVCACNLVVPVGKSQPTISHHLKILVEAGIIARHRRGKWIHYSLSASALEQVMAYCAEVLCVRGEAKAPAGGGPRISDEGGSDA